MWRYKKLTALFLLFSAIYLAQSVLIKPDQTALDKYHISASQAVALGLTVAIPYIVIWFIALLGYLRLRSYAESIADSQDGAAFTIISCGVGLLALWLPISAIIGGFSTHYYAVHPSATATMVILNNYLNLALLFPGFLITYCGTRKLLAVINKSRPALPQKVMLLFICFAVLYTFLVLHDPARLAPTHAVTTAAYYLPDWLIVTTLVIPRLVMWFLGIQAVYNMYWYRQKVKGSIYKQALDHVAQGVGGVVLSTIVLYCVQSLSSPLNQLNLALLLLVVYLLLIIVSIGYLLIAQGAKKLQRLEEL